MDLAFLYFSDGWRRLRIVATARGRRALGCREVQFSFAHMEAGGISLNIAHYLLGSLTGTSFTLGCEDYFRPFLAEA